MEGGDSDLKRLGAMMQDLKRNEGPSGAGKERKKVVKKKLKQEVIDLILKEPYEPMGDDDEEEILEMSEPYRACYARARAIVQELAQFEADIIKQYKSNGYAEVDVLVTIADEEEEDNVVN